MSVWHAFVRPSNGTGSAELLPEPRSYGNSSPMQNKTTILRALFAAYLSNDRRAVEDAFTEDFRFTSPYDDEIDKSSYFARCWRVSDWIDRQELEQIFVEGDGAFVT